MTILLPSSSPMRRQPSWTHAASPLQAAPRAICNVAGMRIGVIGGSGPAGTALGARLASVGYDVVIGSRSKYRAMETRDEIVTQHPELESLVGYGENTVAADCDIVVIATPWDSAATMAQALAPHLRGKIVVSMANALVRVGSEFEPLIPPRGSVAAHVQAAAPESRVVAAFHHLPAKELGAIGHPLESAVLLGGVVWVA